jgi:hypothetical protein
VLYRRLRNPERASQWAGQALEACAVLAEADPVRAYILRAWSHEELDSEAAPVVDIASSFLRIDERRVLMTQLSETSSG